MNMITYEQLQTILPEPPTRELLSLYNEIDNSISEHPKCVNDDNPFDKLNNFGNFCVSATSIQSKYIAFVLGKKAATEFPYEIIKLFFNIDSDYSLQFGEIKGTDIDGCICLVHQERRNYNLQEVYDHIYAR